MGILVKTPLDSTLLTRSTHPENLLSTAKALAESFAGRAAQFDQSRSYCWENVQQMADAGLMGMTIPSKWGGQGVSFLGHRQGGRRNSQGLHAFSAHNR